MDTASTNTVSQANPVILSIVATTYNDCELLPALCDEIEQALRPLQISYEILLVDDRSQDDTDAVIQALCKKNPNIKGLLLARNAGQQIAMSAGLAHCLGKFTIIMDGDLQHPPSAVPEIYQALQNGGKDVVYTVAKTRNSIFHEFGSSFFWWILTRLLKVKVVSNQLMMKGFSRRFVDKYNLYPEATRVVAGIVADVGFSSAVIEVKNRRRLSGESKYRGLDRVDLAIDLILLLSNRPLDLLIYFGFWGVAFTFAGSIYYLIQYFSARSVPPGYTSLILCIFFFGSVIIAMLGIIGRYLSNIYREVRRRPLYIVDKTYNL